MLLGADSPFVVYGGGVAFFAVLGIALGYTVKIMRASFRFSEDQQSAIDSLRSELAATRATYEERIANLDASHVRRLDLCEQRERAVSAKVWLLIGACHAHGVPVPPGVLEEGP